MASIKDVAKTAGVAISTVSKVLNHYPNVSEETKEKVNKAIQELNFVPNSIASALSSKQSGRVAILLNLNTQTQAIDEIDMQYLHGAISKASERNLDVITVFFSMISSMTLEEMIAYFKSQNVSGILIFGMSKDNQLLLDLIDTQQFKIVCVDAPITNANTTCVWIDQKKAQMEVARKTIEGHSVKEILYIAGKANGFVSDYRLKGMEELAQEMNLKLIVRNGEFSELKARQITMELGAKADAIVCASDLMAIGSMRALVEMDIFRPVCGFDGITLMGYAGKQMNTVSQNFYGLASRAVEEIHALLNGGIGKEVITEHKLVRLQYLDIIC